MNNIKKKIIELVSFGQTLIFNFFSVKYHALVGTAGIFVCFLVIFGTTYWFVYDFVVAFIAHKAELSEMIFEIEVNWVVQEKFKKIFITNFRDTFNVFKLQVFYGFDAKTAINLYK